MKEDDHNTSLSIILTSSPVRYFPGMIELGFRVREFGDVCSIGIAFTGILAVALPDSGTSDRGFCLNIFKPFKRFHVVDLACVSRKK